MIKHLQRAFREHCIAGADDADAKIGRIIFRPFDKLVSISGLTRCILAAGFAAEKRIRPTISKSPVQHCSFSKVHDPGYDGGQNSHDSYGYPSRTGIQDGKNTITEAIVGMHGSPSVRIFDQIVKSMVEESLYGSRSPIVLPANANSSLLTTDATTERASSSSHCKALSRHWQHMRAFGGLFQIKGHYFFELAVHCSYNECGKHLQVFPSRPSSWTRLFCRQMRDGSSVSSSEVLIRDDSISSRKNMVSTSSDFEVLRVTYRIAVHI